MNTKKLITRSEYLANSADLHHVYFLQFATEATKRYILSSLKIEDIKKAIESGDIHLNKINIPYNHMSHGGGWWWDDAPINTALVREAGDSLSRSTYTCVAKEMSKEMAK